MRSTLQIAFLLLIVLAFFVGLEVIRVTVGVVGAGAARDLVALASNPLVGLFVGVLATALLQSSSTTTALAVTFAGAGVLPFEAAIPIVMGANVGTSITSTAVAFGHVTRTDEFRRAMASATVHDAFNALAVLLLFPIELATGLIARTSELLVQLTSGLGGDAVLRPVSSVVEPIAEAIVGWVPSAWVALLAGLLMLFGALRLLVRLLREVLLERAEQLLDRYVFGTPGVALLCGALVTMLLQSSSITTSIVVPLAGAGILTTRQVFPFVLGANLGTTITAIVVGFLLAGGDSATGGLALQVAFAHVCFNAFGVGLIASVPALRRLPLQAAERLGRLAADNRALAVGYLVGFFFLLPLLVLFSTRSY